MTSGCGADQFRVRLWVLLTSCRRELTRVFRTACVSISYNSFLVKLTTTFSGRAIRRGGICGVGGGSTCGSGLTGLAGRVLRGGSPRRWTLAQTALRETPKRLAHREAL